MTDYNDMGNETTSSQFIVYALHHSDSDHVYIGQSSRGMLRPQQHDQQAELPKFAHLPRAKWIRSLHARGLKPEIAILEEFENDEDLDDAERFHIAYYKSIGIPLLNCTEGGDGGAEISRRYWSDPASREKKRVERTGRKHSAETKAKMAASAKGKTKSAEHCAAMSEARKRNWATPGYREKQVESQKVAQNQSNVVAKKSEAATTQWADQDARDRKSEQSRRHWQDPKNKAKLSEAMKRSWERR